MIHIVGAGPGDPELITVKGARYLAEADVVIYAGSLVNPALLDMCRDDAEIHNSAHMTLDEVVETIARAPCVCIRVIPRSTGPFRSRWMHGRNVASTMMSCPA